MPGAGGNLLIAGKALFYTILLPFVMYPAAAGEIRLYEASVPLSSRSDQIVRAAQRKALEWVLVRLTGDRYVAGREGVRRRIGNVESYIVSQGYLAASAPAFDPQTGVGIGDQDDRARPDPDGGELLAVSFSPARINRLIRDADLPLWDAIRPQTVAWIVMQQGSEKSVLGQDSDPALEKALVALARDRGTPLILPLMDLQEWQALPPELVWGDFRVDIGEASQRYGADSILIGRLTAAKAPQTDIWDGDWEFWWAEERLLRKTEGKDLATTLDEVVNWMADELAARFAIVLSAGDRSHWLQVDAVANVRAYAHVLTYFKKLAAVTSVQVTRFQGESVLLHLRTPMTGEQLLHFVRIEPRLQPSGEARDDVIRLRFGETQH